MPSTYSTSLRLNYQAPGDNLNSWGTFLNTGVFQLLEDANSKPVTFTLSGTKTLTSVNGATDEARCAWLNVTGGTGGTVTVPSVNKTYGVRNGSSGDVIVTTGAGTSATIHAGEQGMVLCDGSNVYRPIVRDFGGLEAVNGAIPTSPTSYATKAYVDAQAWAASIPTLPGQTGQAGKFMTTDGTTPSWAYPTVSAISDYASDQATKTAAAKAFAVCWALVF